MKPIIAVLLLGLVINNSQASSPCQDVPERISYQNAETLLPTRELTITVCNASAVQYNQPISLESYQEYLKLFRDRDLRSIYPNTFSLLPNLKTLIISQVGLSNLQAGAFNGLDSLLYLNLKGNRIQSMPNNIFDDIPHVLEIDLEENQINLITELHFLRLNSLRKLKLSNNNIGYLPSKWASGLSNLEYLSLSYNQITTLTTGMFEGLSKLETLRINNNAITVLQHDCLSALTALRSLSIQYNGLLKSDNLLDELKSLQSLNGLAISPSNLECGILPLISEWANEKNVELVQIPAVKSCWQH